MKSTLGIVAILLVLSGCGSTSEVKSVSTLPAETMILGWAERSDLDRPEYPQFRQVYDTVHIAADFLELIRQLHQDIEVTIVLGSWCGDSKREVPRFLKLADSSGIQPEQIRLYGVDRTKKSADGVTDTYDIHRVPTFVFMKDGAEIGRIVERPNVSIEADVLTILAGARSR